MDDVVVSNEAAVEPHALLESLIQQTCVRSVQWLAVAESTNSLALQHAAEVPPAELPRLYWADRQTAGRGRGQNSWWSGPGSLTFSLLIAPSEWRLPPALWPQVSLVTAIAVSETLQQRFPELPIGVKWPNDIFCRGRKLGGILLEPSDRAPDRLVIGIGLNVNNSLRNAPDAVRELATSLADEMGTTLERQIVLADILQVFAARCRDLAAGQLVWSELWPRHCVLTGRRVRVTAGERIVEGTCLGVAEDGALQVGNRDGTERCLGGTVRVISEV